MPHVASFVSLENHKDLGHGYDFARDKLLGGPYGGGPLQPVPYSVFDYHMIDSQ